VNFPGLSVLYTLNKEFGITMDWILLGKGPMMQKAMDKEKELESLNRDIAVKEKRDTLDKDLAVMKKMFAGGKLEELGQEPEFRELLAAMANSRQLYYEVLACYQKHKST
ncbi:MAG: hypothetical protein GY757_25755, partial [bacterium]|nr:hypothetical protein [bacterium]